jgi:microcystin-dependent protein
MPVNYDPIVHDTAASAANFNAPLQQLDDAIEDIGSGDKELLSPNIAGFENSVHDHSDNTSGGVLTTDAISSSGANEGDVLTAAAAGATEWTFIAGVPTGAILPYGGSTAPSGWLLCDGTSIDRTTYAGLFGVVGTSFGSASGSTFNLPDMRGRVPAGLDNIGSSSADTVTNANADSMGGTMGAETHTLTIGQIPAHDHGGYSGFDSSGSGLQPAAGGTDTVTAMSSQGGGGAHNNMQPTLFLNYIIKVGPEDG